MRNKGFTKKFNNKSLVILPEDAFKPFLREDIFTEESKLFTKKRLNITSSLK